MFNALDVSSSCNENGNGGVISIEGMNVSKGRAGTIGSDTGVPCSMLWMSVARVTKIGNGGLISTEGMSASVGSAATIGVERGVLDEVIHPKQLEIIVRT